MNKNIRQSLTVELLHPGTVSTKLLNKSLKNDNRLEKEEKNVFKPLHYTLPVLYHPTDVEK